MLDPDVIVLGGGLSNIDRLYTSVPRLWAPHVFSDRVDHATRPREARRLERRPRRRVAMGGQAVRLGADPRVVRVRREAGHRESAAVSRGRAKPDTTSRSPQRVSVQTSVSATPAPAACSHSSVCSCRNSRPTTMNTAAASRQPPVELLVRDLQAARAGAPARGVDDPVGDLAVAFAIELEVLAAAGVGDHRQRRAIERRANRRLDAATCRSACARGSGMSPPTVVPTPTTKTGTSLVRASLQRARHLAAPRLAVGDQHERLRVRRLAVQLGVLLDQPHAPRDAELDVGVPAWCRPRGGTAIPARGDRGRRRTCSDPWSAAPAARRCARTAPSRCGRPSTPAIRRARAGTASTAASGRRPRPACASTPSRPAG